MGLVPAVHAAKLRGGVVSEGGTNDAAALRILSARDPSPPGD
jgi:hypothetical protein